MRPSGIDVGFTVQERHFARGVADLQAFLARLEDRGCDFTAVLDHLTFWDGTGFDAITNATALAAAHPRLPVLTSVVVLPLHHPVLVARHLSSLALLAPGRLAFGVGVGGEDRHEIASGGVDQSTRGRRMDESLTILRALLAGGRVRHDGAFYAVDDVTILPVPDPPVPVLVGGRSDAALRRAGRLGDGWLGFACSPTRFDHAVKLVAVEAERAGRDADAFDHGLVVWCGFGSDGDARERLAAEVERLYKLPFERFERYCPYGTPAEVAESLAEYVPAGCRRFSIIPVGADPAAEADAVAEVRELLTTS